MRFPKQELQVIAMALAFLIAAFVVVALITACDDGAGDDDDLDCDPRFEPCGSTDADTDADADADADVTPACTEEYTGYDSCHCLSPYVCSGDDHIEWAPGCDATDDPNDAEPANICCCHDYD